MTSAEPSVRCSQTTWPARTETRESRYPTVTANIERTVPHQEYFTPSEIADLLGVKPYTVRGWLKDPSHTLKGIYLSKRSIRVPRAILVKFLEERYGNQTTAGL